MVIPTAQRKSLLRLPPIVVVGSAATFNSADKSANITLSNSDLTATSSATNSAVRSIRSRASGKYGFSWSGGVGGLTVGICLSTDSLSANMGTEPGAYVFYGPGGQVYHNGSTTGMPSADNTGGGAAGACVFDFDLGRGWFYNTATGKWNNSATADPAASTESFTVTASTFFAVFGATAASDQVTVNFATPSLPSGFNPWG